jgi:hypothetical protein
MSLSCVAFAVIVRQLLLLACEAFSGNAGASVTSTYLTCLRDSKWSTVQCLMKVHKKVQYMIFSGHLCTSMQLNKTHYTFHLHIHCRHPHSFHLSDPSRGAWRRWYQLFDWVSCDMRAFLYIWHLPLTSLCFVFYDVFASFVFYIFPFGSTAQFRPWSPPWNFLFHFSY